MRVVANFPSSPRASESLLKTAAIMEKLNDTKTALTLYQQVARDYDGQPVGADAKKSVTRLSGK
jgi:TolA-binding protein